MATRRRRATRPELRRELDRLRELERLLMLDTAEAAVEATQVALDDARTGLALRRLEQQLRR